MPHSTPDMCRTGCLITKKRITIMKKAYIKPSIEIMGLSTDNLLNNGSIVNRKGENLGNLGYDPSGGEESEDGYVWGD